MVWIRKQTIDPEQDGWRIFRTKPAREAVGFAIPIFINNFHYHLTTVDVYEDGAIDCWGFLDVDLFRKKVASGWVATQPPNGNLISIFNLGAAEIAAADWYLTPMMIQTAVEDAIGFLNPASKDLLDMQGDDSEVRDGARYAKLGLADEKPYRMTESGNRILGAELPVLRREGDEFIVAHLFAYADGKAEVTGDSELQSVEELSSRFSNGDLTLDVSDGSWITIPPLGRFKTKNGSWYVKANERVREALDEVEKLGGGMGAIQLCLAAHDAFNEESTEEKKKQLQEAYEAVPEHLRIYCGDMDSKDWPIRRILYGEEFE